MKENEDSRGRPDDDLSRLYRDVEQPEPSAALDAVIIGAARHAAGGSPQVTSAKGGLQRWRLPFALAATVVFSVVVTTLVRDELPPGTVAIPLPDVAQPGAATESAVAGASVRSVTPARLARPADEPVVPMKHEAVQASAEAPAAASGRMRARMDPAVQPAMQAAPATQGEGVEGMAGAASTPANSVDKAVSVMVAPGAPEKRAISPGLYEQAPKDAAVMRAESANAWIADIRELKRLGRATEAAGKLAEMRRRFPDVTLPDDLK